MIYEASRAAYPREACGLLIGSKQRATRAAECRNLATERDRFELHPEDFLKAELEARAAGLAVIGAWHSHPDQPAIPSARDLENAFEAWVHVICSVTASEVRELRGWRRSGSNFTEYRVR